MTGLAPSVGYLRIQGGQIARTAEVAPGVLVDVDEDGRILGIESIGKVDFHAVAFDVLRSVRIQLPAGDPSQEQAEAS